MKAFPSISIQILIAVLITIVPVLGVSSIIELNVLKDREAQMLHDRGELTADRLANNIAYPLWNLGREQTERVVLDEISSPDVVSIRVLDENGDLYVGKSRGADGVVRNIEAPAAAGTGAATAPSVATYSYSRPINFKGRAIGRMVLELTDASLQSELAKLRWGIASKPRCWLFSCQSFCTSCCAVLVIRPLSTLKSWVDDIPAEPTFSAASFKRSGNQCAGGSLR